MSHPVEVNLVATASALGSGAARISIAWAHGKLIFEGPISAQRQVNLKLMVSVARSQQAATLLPSGAVLIVGGRGSHSASNATTSAELFYPAQ